MTTFYNSCFSIYGLHLKETVTFTAVAAVDGHTEIYWMALPTEDCALVVLLAVQPS